MVGGGGGDVNARFDFSIRLARLFWWFFRHSKAVDAMDMDGGGGQHDVNTSDKSIVRVVVP